MADDYDFTPGTGKTAAAQDLGGKLHPKIVGAVAHDAAAAGNPVLNGAQARQTNPTAVADADCTNLIADDVGRLVTRLGQVRDLMGTQRTTITASTTETTVATAVASTFLDLVFVLINNTSGTAVRVDFRDDTAGTIIFDLYCPAGQATGFALTRPLNQTSVNKNWTAQCSAAVTDIRILMQFEKNI